MLSSPSMHPTQNLQQMLQSGKKRLIIQLNYDYVKYFDFPVCVYSVSSPSNPVKAGGALFTLLNTVAFFDGGFPWREKHKERLYKAVSSSSFLWPCYGLEQVLKHSAIWLIFIKLLVCTPVQQPHHSDSYSCWRKPLSPVLARSKWKYLLA